MRIQPYVGVNGYARLIGSVPVVVELGTSDISTSKHEYCSHMTTSYRELFTHNNLSIQVAALSTGS